jgi:hypothetical protein
MDIAKRLRQEIGGYTDVHLEKAEANMQEAADEIERLRKRVELLEGYLNGALNVIEGFVHCDTTEARKALREKE